MSLENNKSLRMTMTEDQKDILVELLNIGMGKAASQLNEMLDRPVEIKVPDIKLLLADQLEEEEVKLQFSKLISSVSMEFSGFINGKTALVFPPESAQKLVEALTGEEPGTPEMDSVTVETLSEIGNIVINSVMGSLSNSLGNRLGYSTPTYVEDSLSKVALANSDNSDQIILLAEVAFSISKLEISGKIILIFRLGSLEKLTEILDSLC
jgi:chemotaxis protein CheC